MCARARRIYDISNSRSSRTIGSIDRSIDRRVAVQLSESCPRSWTAIVYTLSKVRLAGRLTRLMTSRLRYRSTFFMLNKEIVVLSPASAREGMISQPTTRDSYRNSRRRWQSATWEPERPARRDYKCALYISSRLGKLRLNVKSRWGNAKTVSNAILF